MYIVHCPYPARQVKRLINQLMSMGIARVSKINYVKSYIPQGKKSTMQKEYIINIHASEEQKPTITSFLQKHMADCCVYEMTEKKIQ